MSREFSLVCSSGAGLARTKGEASVREAQRNGAPVPAEALPGPASHPDNRRKVVGHDPSGVATRGIQSAGIPGAKRRRAATGGGITAPFSVAKGLYLAAGQIGDEERAQGGDSEAVLRRKRGPKVHSAIHWQAGNGKSWARKGNARPQPTELAARGPHIIDVQKKVGRTCWVFRLRTKIPENGI